MNQTVLLAQLQSRQAKRYTPAGEPSLRLTLQHHSEQVENGLVRRVSLDIQALALGQDLVERLETASLGSDFQVHGFLSNGMHGKGVILRLTQVQAVQLSAN